MEEELSQAQADAEAERSMRVDTQTRLDAVESQLEDALDALRGLETWATERDKDCDGPWPAEIRAARAVLKANGS